MAMSPAASGPRFFSSSKRICGHALPQPPLLAIGLTMILVFTAISARDRFSSLMSDAVENQSELEAFGDPAAACSGERDCLDGDQHARYVGAEAGHRTRRFRL